MSNCKNDELNNRKFYLSKYLSEGKVLVGWLVVWVLWRINLCRLFNDKFCLYIYIPFTNEYLVGKIFYKQDFTCLHMINQF